ncbi:MAG: amidohydrolase family protein [Nitrospinota bacterium]
MYDLLFLDAELYDGTGAPARRGDLAVAGDRIAALGRLPSRRARRVIRCEGRALAPGFIDIHSHSDYHLLINPLAESKVRQGVTTEVGGNCGYAAAPISGPALEERSKTYRDLYGLDHGWEELSDYLARLEGAGISVNYVALAGHNTVRASAMGGADRPPTAEELEAMGAALERAMEQGAFGLSTGLIYPPACFASREELVALAKVAARRGGILTAHMRSEGDALLEAVEEVLEVSRGAGIPLQISHLKTAGERNWNKLEGAFHLIEEARAGGQDVTCDRYPYLASNAGLGACLPHWVHEGSLADKTQRLTDPECRARIRADILAEHPEPEYWDLIVISHLTLPQNKGYEGLSLRAAAARAGQEPLEFMLDLLAAECMNVEALMFVMCEENLRVILRKPYVMVGSDAGARAHYGPLSEGCPHPRGFGTFPMVLGRYVRELGLLNLSQAIRKMTWDPARRLGLERRGKLAPGFAADLVLLDPDRVADLASYEAPRRYPAGIDLVAVNGKLTVEGGEHLGARAGRALRKGVP